MLDYNGRGYSDCEFCKGVGERQGDAGWGFKWAICSICTERYITELRELLHDILACEIPNGVAEKIVPLLQDRPLTPQERLDNAHEAAGMM